MNIASMLLLIFKHFAGSEVPFTSIQITEVKYNKKTLLAKILVVLII